MSFFLWSIFLKFSFLRFVLLEVFLFKVFLSKFSIVYPFTKTFAFEELPKEEVKEEPNAMDANELNNTDVWHSDRSGWNRQSDVEMGEARRLRPATLPDGDDRFNPKMRGKAGEIGNFRVYVCDNSGCGRECRFYSQECRFDGQYLYSPLI